MNLLLFEVLVKLSDHFSGGLGLLYKTMLILWPKLNIFCLLKQDIRSNRILFKIYETFLGGDITKMMMLFFLCIGNNKSLFCYRTDYICVNKPIP